MNTPTLSIVLPAKDEGENLKLLLPRLVAVLATQGRASEVIVVDDGSTDATREICAQHGVRVVSHPYPLGNGAAIKTGARAARGEIVLMMDADGQHDPALIPVLLDKLDEGHDMVVGARQSGSHAGLHRAAANGFYNRFASWMVGQPIADLTSGFRAIRTERFRRFLHLLPNKFSYPTTITMSFFRAGFSVAFVPFHAQKRGGRSHIRVVRDGMRFLVILIRIGTLYSPLKVFLPISAAFVLTGIGHYAYSYMTTGRFTNMSALLFITAILTFLIGIVSEQISALHYKDSER
jgi:glycosyltransferase involved in cell wall biosynthesis